MRLSICVCFLTFTLSTALPASAQETKSNSIVVIGSASLDVPADKAIIHIRLSYSDSLDGKKAFEQHRGAQEKLFRFIRGKSIPDSLVSYSLLNITSSVYYRAPISGKVYNTNQTVNITVADISRLTAMELDLVANDFTTFSEEFQSTKAREAEKEAIQAAVKQARAKADIMAAAAGRRIKRASKVSDTEDTEPVIARQVARMDMSSVSIKAAPDLTNIPQFIRVDKQVKVVFELQD